MNYITYELNDYPGVFNTQELGDQTGEEFAEQNGIPPEKWAEFDMSTQPEGSVNYLTSFYVIVNLPKPNTVGFNLDSAKGVSTRFVKNEASAAEAALTLGYSPFAVAAQSALAQADRDTEFQILIDEVNLVTANLQEKLMLIQASTNVTELSNITFPGVTE